MRKPISYGQGIALVTAACMLFITGCSERKIVTENKFEQISFSWWGKDSRNENIIDALSIFAEQNPDIIVKPDYGDFDGFKSKMDIEYYSDTEADVMQINYGWLYEYSPDGEGFYDIYELTDYIDLSNFTDEQLEYGIVNGKLNAIPISINTITFFYNKTLFDNYGLALPKTWDDIFAAAAVMKQDGIYILTMTAKNFWLACSAYNEQLTGKTPFDAQGNFCCTQEDMQNMIKFYLRLVSENVAKQPSDYNYKDFSNGVSAGITSWISDADYYCGSAIEAGYEICVGDYPMTESPLSFGWYLKPTSYYAIKEDTANPESAAKLVNFLLNSEDMASVQGTANGIPVSRSALETLEAKDMLNGIQYSANQKLNSTNDLNLMNPELENSEIINVFTDACTNVYYSKLTLEEAAEQACERINSLLE